MILVHKEKANKVTQRVCSQCFATYARKYATDATEAADATSQHAKITAVSVLA